MTTPHLIDSFSGEYRFLSNFFPSVFEVDGRKYQTVEHCFQAYKTTCEEHHERVRVAATPGSAKRLGRMLPLRHDWEDIKDEVMEMCLIAKFGAHPDLALRLLQTGDAILIEGNTWGDTYWGVCRGKGQNKLGQLLMKVRGLIR